MARLIFVVFCLLLQSSFPQGNNNFFQQADHIPLLVAIGMSDTTYQYNMLDLMGAEIIKIDGLSRNLYNQIKNTAPNLKLVPYTVPEPELYQNDIIAKYSEGMYGEWSVVGNTAEGKYQFWNNTLKVDQIGEIIRTKPDSSGGMILCGPGEWYNGIFYYDYPQQAKFLIAPTSWINYNISINLKLETNINNPTDTLLGTPNYNPPICTLEVGYWKFVKDRGGADSTDTFFPKASKVLFLGDFQDTLWNPFSFDDEYTWQNTALSEVRTNSKGTEATRDYQLRMEFRLIWSGYPHRTLSARNLILSDEDRGKGLMEEEFDTDVMKITQNILPGDEILFDDLDYDNRVISWYAVDEPGSFENFACMKRIDSLMNLASNGKRRLYYTYAGCFNGRAGKNIDVHKEQLKRTGSIIYPTLQKYIVESPYQSLEPDNPVVTYVADLSYCNWANIEHFLINIKQYSDYDKDNNYTRPFGLMLQTGKWRPVLIGIPSKEQFLYTANFGLLFGAKLLALDNYFYGNNVADQTSLYNTANQEYSLLWHTIKDTLSPRLKGLMGKTLMNLNSTYQKTGINAQDDLSENINTGKLNYIHILPTEQDPPNALDVSIADVGIFHHKEITETTEYFIVVSRHYSTYDNFSIGLKDLDNYKNWTLENLTDTISRTLISGLDNTSSFNETIDNGDGKLYGIAPTVKYGGEINHDETVTSETLTENDLTINSGKTLTVMGTYDCYKNIIVNSGGTLDIKPGSTLNFHNGSKIVVNGLFTANGKSDTLINIDFQSVSSNPQNGIFFGNSSSGSIDNCTIENGYYGVSASSCSLIIKNSKIRDCTTGIYMYGCSYNSSETEIDACEIHDNSLWGIELNNSAPIITNTKISGSMVGIRCVSNSNAILATTELQAGLNEIGGVNHGIYVYSSDPFLGNFDLPYEYGGYNSIIGEDYHAVVEMDSYVMGQLNWWGSSDPQAEEFIEEDGGIIDYRNYLDYSPFKETMSPGTEGEFSVMGEVGTIALESMTTEAKYEKAVIYYLKNRKTEARVYCNSILDEEVETGLKYSALRLLVRCIDEDSVRTNVIGKINNTLLTTAQTDYNAYLEMTLADILRSNYLTSLDGIMTKYRNTAYKPLILFRKFSYLYFEEENRDSARVIANIMGDLYPDHELTKSAKMMFGVTTLKKETEETSIIPKEYKLYQNYPNPFNPETVISYQLPVNSKVILVIYDMLGREVKKLVDEEQEAGKYEIKFNSGKLASGVYVYRIKAGEFMMSKKMMLLK